MKISKIQILIAVILIAGIVGGVYLIQHPQIFKSKAGQTIYNAFEITDDTGNAIPCIENNCNTDSLDVNIKIKDINALVE